jgi:hypothetical protein
MSETGGVWSRSTAFTGTGQKDRFSARSDASKGGRRMGPCKVTGSNRTKVFHVKRFGKEKPLNRTKRACRAAVTATPFPSLLLLALEQKRCDIADAWRPFGCEGQRAAYRHGGQPDARCQ